MTLSASQLLPLIVLLPLIGAAVNGFLGHRFSRRYVHMIGVGSVAIAFLLAVRAVWSLMEIAGTDPYEPAISHVAYQWVVTGMFQFDVAFYLDPLSAVMLMVVTGVGLLIHIYSTGYMSEDPGIARYFAYLNLFMFSMLCLILGKNLFLLFVGWEGVGLCSYLLIGFWFTDDQKAQAGQKAFVVNRIGDLGFIIGMILLLYHAGGSADYDVLRWASQAGPYGPFHDPMTLTGCCLLLFLGACGKSAQIPLYVWLPDAMAGPTPVSALIHAATMVTAGVYMIARLGFLFTLSPVAMGVVASVGAATALAAAFMALTQRDIKGVLAYSTVSQLGYMVLAVGVGAYVAGIFHLMTHAFFKALLFLAAGSVIHGLSGQQDIFKMGGIKAKMPITRITFLIATLAIAGAPFFSGFYSKDAVLWETLTRKQLLKVPQQVRASHSTGDTLLIGGKQAVVLMGSGDNWQRFQLPPTDALVRGLKQKILPTVRGLTIGEGDLGWVVTENGTIYTYTDDGWAKAWQVADGPQGRHLNDVWAAGEDDVWFVGERGLVVHWDGDEFASVESSTTVALHAITGKSGAEIYAGGAGGVLLKYDGTSWTRVPSTGSDSITDLAVVNDEFYATTAQGSLLKVGGTGWEKVPLTVSGITQIRQLNGIASGTDILTVAGVVHLEGETSPRPAILQFTGEGEGAWVASLGDPGPVIRTVGATTDGVYAAGDGGRLLMLDAASGTLIEAESVPYKPWFHYLLYVVAVLAAALTAFYMFRLYFLTFEGETRADAHTWSHAHESPPAMTVPLIILAVLSVIGGWWGDALTEWLAPVFRIADSRLLADHHHTLIAYLPTAFAASGVLVAVLWYGTGSRAPQKLAVQMPWLYRTLYNKFYIDELYDAVVIRPYYLVSGVLHRFFDALLIDRILVGGVAWVVRAFGSVFRGFQSGNVQHYAVAILLGLCGIVLFMGF